MAHLMRRAGFGASRDELEEKVSAGYDNTVENLLNPGNVPPVDIYEFIRYFPMWWKPGTMGGLGQAPWVWTMINTQAPLQEKMCLFYHNIFATGVAKVDHYDEIQDMVDMFREKGLGHYKEILVEVAKSPAMIYWLDNNDNHADSINENWGRELLELFTMGVGNYTEYDVVQCSKAFTGWTLEHKLPRFHMGRWDWEFKFIEEDHDYGNKNFLGHIGDFDGEDIIDIIAKQEATARFIGRHLYNFFVADEAQVPAWSIDPPANPQAIDDLVKTWMESDADIRAVLRTLFTSDWFKEARFTHVKSPTEFVAGVLKLSGEFAEPAPNLHKLETTIVTMGQKLMDPPSVEGWHTGKEWIDGGTLTERVNYAVDTLNDPKKPGVKAIIDRVRASGQIAPNELVNKLLELSGSLEVDAATRDVLIAHAESEGELDWSSGSAIEASTTRVVRMLTLVVATREYQFA